MTLRIAWFATARGTSSQLLLDTVQAAIEQGHLDAEIVVVFCNRERGQSENTDAFLSAVDSWGLPLVLISSGAWRKRVGGTRSDPGGQLAPWRHDFDHAVRQAIEPFRPEVGILAGYMLVATAELCEHLPLLNLHPAEPEGPIGTWREVNSMLIGEGADSSGLMLQLASADLDRGPILTWCAYPIRGGRLDRLWAARPDPTDEASPLFGAIRAEGVRREPIFIMESLRALAEGRLAMPAPHDDGPRLNLTADVENVLATVD